MAMDHLLATIDSPGVSDRFADRLLSDAVVAARLASSGVCHRRSGVAIRDARGCIQDD